MGRLLRPPSDEIVNVHISAVHPINVSIGIKSKHFIKNMAIRSMFNGITLMNAATYATERP